MRNTPLPDSTGANFGGGRLRSVLQCKQPTFLTPNKMPNPCPVLPRPSLNPEAYLSLQKGALFLKTVKSSVPFCGAGYQESRWFPPHW